MLLAINLLTKPLNMDENISFRTISITFNVYDQKECKGPIWALVFFIYYHHKVESSIQLSLLRAKVYVAYRIYRFKSQVPHVTFSEHQVFHIFTQELR